MTRSEKVDLAAEMAHWPPSDASVRCPFQFMAQARERSPVMAFATPNELGHPVYLVTGQAECAYVLSHHREFGSDLAGVMPGFDKSAVPPPFPEVKSFHELPVVFFSGGEDHKIKRKWSMELLSRQRIRGWLPDLERLMDRIIDGFAGSDECDFRAQFSDLFPVQALGIILNLPPEGESILRRVSLSIAETDVDPDITPAQAAEKMQAMADLFALNRRLLEERLAEPREDYISILARTQVDQDGALDVNTLAIHLQGIQFGGDHAVGAFLAYLVAALASRPDIQRQLREQPTLIDSFVFETLRMEPPIPWLFRKCEVETSVGGQRIPQGAIVVVASVAANRDPACFPEPDQFLASREKLDQWILSFGRGVHRCVGEPLARAMGELLIRRMLSRFADIGLKTPDSIIDPPLSYQFRCPTRVILKLRPAAQAIGANPS